MTLQLEPEIGVPYSDKMTFMDLRDRAKAACTTAKMLKEHGLSLVPSAEDQDIAAKLALAYADNPEGTSKKANTSRVAKLTPASLVIVDQVLSDFSHSIVQSATQVRHLVMNKLLIETENIDPRVRMQALTLLGKVSDVGLFTEKSEVTITHRTTDELREALRSKLARLVNPPDIDENPIVIEGVIINVDQELGIEGDDDE